MGVVLAAGGYPNDYAKGDVIEGLDAAAALPGKVFHAGTQSQPGTEGNRIVTAGGRVLCATALGESVTQAQQAARLADAISWPGCTKRRDIAYRAIARETAQASSATSSLNR